MKSDFGNINHVAITNARTDTIGQDHNRLSSQIIAVSVAQLPRDKKVKSILLLEKKELNIK